jgi:hypothetical protein
MDERYFYVAAFHKIVPEAFIYQHNGSNLAWLQREDITLVSQSQNDLSYGNNELAATCTYPPMPIDPDDRDVLVCPQTQYL